MDGGAYGYRTPGSPRHWGEEVPGNVPKLVGTGNGSPCGIMVYEGSLLPGAYKGCLFEADAGTRQINFFPIERHASNFRTEYKVLLGSDDPWFRPVDMTAAPDGSIFVADWYDAGVGGHAFRDQDTGRIYRVAPKGHKPPIAEARLRHDPRPDRRAQVARRRRPGRRPPVPDRARGRGQGRRSPRLFAKGDPIERARALWVRHAIEGDAVAIAALKDGDPAIREQAVRILGRDISRVGNVVFTEPEAKKPPAAHGAPRASSCRWPNDPDAGRPPRADPGPPLAPDRRGRRRPQGPGQGLGRPGPLVPRSPRPGARRTARARTWPSCSTARPSATSTSRRPARTARSRCPPYFPADRNEAYIAAGTPDLPANALSKSLGLAWRLHRPEVAAAPAEDLPRRWPRPSCSRRSTTRSCRSTTRRPPCSWPSRRSRRSTRPGSSP